MNSLQPKQRHSIFTSLTLNANQNLSVQHNSSISIQIIDLSKNKIDELNQKSTELNKKIKYQTIKEEDLNNYIIDIITILELILNDTYTPSSQIQPVYQNPYIEAIESSLFFLSYLKELEIKFKKNIFMDFKNDLERRIDALIANKNQLFFELYLYEYLLKKKYISAHTYNDFYFTKKELFDWYEKFNQKIIQYFVKNFNHYNSECRISLDNPRKNALNKIYFKMQKQLEDLYIQNTSIIPLSS